MVKKDEKYYAYFEHETVQAMLHSLFRFQSAMQAQLVSNRFADEVILAPKMSDPKDRKAIFLWVRDLDVTDEQRKQGYCGNFAKISLVKLPNGKWTLTMIRVDIPLNKHPIFVRVSRRYPNSGHPVIRAADRGKSFESMMAANDALMKLHEEYPEVSIPGVNRLKIMSYRKAPKGESPIQRLELNVVKRGEDDYIITLKDTRNDPTRRHSVVPPSQRPDEDAIAKQTSEKPTKEVEGFYTKMVQQKRKGKKRTPALKTKKKPIVVKKNSSD